jgi:cob(I)alamin adenosyltransferase
LVDSYGRFDELNTRIGQLVVTLNSSHYDFSEAVEFLKGCQSQIFCFGSYLASKMEKQSFIENSGAWVLDMEVYIDKMEESLPQLKNFILPGGSEAACCAHLCRVEARSAERFLVAASKDLASEELLKDVILYLNRLSDFFFVLSRMINLKLNAEETIWKV